MSETAIDGNRLSGLQELLELQDNGDILYVVDAEGNSKSMQANILCWQLMELLCGNNYQARNGIYRGKDLTDVYTVDQLYTKVHNGDWSNLFIGDYITVSITTSLGGTEKVDEVFAHFNYFLSCGSTALNTNHILMVPRDCFGTTASMNETNTTEGGFLGSAMWTDVLPVYSEALLTANNNHLVYHYRYLTNTVNTSAPSAGGANLTGSTTAAEWIQTYICLLSEAMVYGGSVFSSSGRDISDACSQLAIFQLMPNFRIARLGYGSSSRNGWWLCAVASSANFCRCAASGYANYYNASSAYGVRPYFLFG